MSDSLYIGAHLTTRRWGYVHHGIYAGGNRVIHYAGFSGLLRRGPIEDVPLERFSRGRRCQVKGETASRFSGIARVERARTRLGEDRYRFWSNNCEHFAEWCISGSNRSAQVEGWKMRFDKLFAPLRFATLRSNRPSPPRELSNLAT